MFNNINLDKNFNQSKTINTSNYKKSVFIDKDNKKEYQFGELLNNYKLKNSNKLHNNNIKENYNYDSNSNIKKRRSFIEICNNNYKNKNIFEPIKEIEEENNDINDYVFIKKNNEISNDMISFNKHNYDNNKNTKSNTDISSIDNNIINNKYHKINNFEKFKIINNRQLENNSKRIKESDLNDINKIEINNNDNKYNNNYYTPKSILKKTNTISINELNILNKISNQNTTNKQNFLKKNTFNINLFNTSKDYSNFVLSSDRKLIDNEITNISPIKFKKNSDTSNARLSIIDLKCLKEENFNLKGIDDFKSKSNNDLINLNAVNNNLLKNHFNSDNNDNNSYSKENINKDSVCYVEESTMNKKGTLESNSYNKSFCNSYATNSNNISIENSDNKDNLIINNNNNNNKVKNLNSINKTVSIKHINNNLLEEGTRLNLEALDKIEDNERYDMSKIIYNSCIDIYLNTYYEREESFSEINMLYESKIFNLDKFNYKTMLKNHVVIIGIQDCLGRIIKLINNTFLKKKVCLLVNSFQPSDYHNKRVIKLLKSFKNLYVFIGEAQNPHHMLNINLNEAHMILFFTEDSFYNNYNSLSNISQLSTNEDMQKILSFKSIDYFFNVPVFIVELWSRKSTKLLGYRPLDRKTDIIINEFLHPLFMSGNLLYLDMFDKLLAKSYYQEYEYEVWNRLVSLGYNSASNAYGFLPKLNSKSKLGFPVIITFDLPDFYYEKDYHNLVGDLLALDDPAIPLGLYISEPLQYMNMKYEGGVVIDENKKEMVTMSHKNKMKNINQMDALELKYLKSLELLQEISYTNKIVMDVVDIERNYLPVFITNPPPDFKLLNNIKVTVLYFFKIKYGDDNFNNKLKQVNKERGFKYESSDDSNNTSINDINDDIKIKDDDNLNSIEQNEEITSQNNAEKLNKKYIKNREKLINSQHKIEYYIHTLKNVLSEQTEKAHNRLNTRIEKNYKNLEFKNELNNNILKTNTCKL